MTILILSGLFVLKYIYTNSYETIFTNVIHLFLKTSNAITKTVSEHI